MIIPLGVGTRLLFPSAIVCFSKKPFSSNQFVMEVVLSMQEKDESLESYYISLVGGDNHA